mgnify:CR=1 FL=1
MKKEDIEEFIKFRQKFSKREWFEINKAVEDQEREIANQIVLSEQDIYEVLDRIFDNLL